MQRSETNPEFEYLLDIVRGKKSASSAIDWDRFYELVKFHNLIDLVTDREELYPADVFNEKILNPLLADKRSSAVQRMALKHGFYDLVNFLRNNDIPFILFKGIYFSDLVYPPGEPRQFADHDILVHKRDFVRAEQLLLKNGYEKFPSLSNRFDIEACAKLGISRAYYHSRARYLHIDLHASLSIAPGPQFIQPFECWSNANEAVIDGVRFKVLSPEVGLFHLCWHTLKHSFVRLIWFKDIWHYVKRFESALNNEVFRGMVANYKAEKVAVTALKLTAELFEDERLSKKVDILFPKYKLTDNFYFKIPDIFQPRRDISARIRIKRDLSLLHGFRSKMKYLFRSIFPHPKLTTEPPLGVKYRFDLRYLFGGIKVFIQALSDKVDFKTKPNLKNSPQSHKGHRDAQR